MWIDRRRLVMAVGASLLLNVFLVGLVAGHFYAGRRAPGVQAPGPLVRTAHVRALPQDDRRKFAAAMAAHRPVIRATRVAHRAARLALENDIAAPTYDRGKLDTDFKTLRQTNSALQEAINDALLDALADLTPASRAALVAHDEDKAAPKP